MCDDAKMGDMGS